MNSRILFLVVCLSGFAGILPVKADTESSALDRSITFSCHRIGTQSENWTLKDQSGSFLSVDPKENPFELHPKIQTHLLCGNPVRGAKLELEIHPKLYAKTTARGFRASFERQSDGGFKVWLQQKKTRSCELVCQPKNP